MYVGVLYYKEEFDGYSGREYTYRQEERFWRHNIIGGAMPGMPLTL